MEGNPCLVTLPDCAWDLVLQDLYSTPPDADLHKPLPPCTIAALASTCHGLRDIVRRVRTRTCYKFRGSAWSGRDCAQHLNRHNSCTTVLVNADFGRVMPWKELTAFQGHVSSSTSARVTHLSVCCLGPTWPSLDISVVVMLARTLPGLTTLEVQAPVCGTDDLFTCLVACCPHLRKLKACLPDFNRDSLASLPALAAGLTSLTSLELKDSRPHGHTRDGECYAVDLHTHLPELTCLTHLCLAFSDDDDRDYFSANRRLFKPLAHLSQALRSLELVGGWWLGVRDFPVLAAALPSLESLRASCLGGASDASTGVPDHASWRLPNLTVMGFTGDAFVSVQAALHLMEGCPALQRLRGVGVELDFAVRRLARGKVSAGPDAAAVRRWVQGLGAMAARGLLAAESLSVSVARAEQAVLLGEALEQLAVQLPEQHVALQGCVRQLAAKGVADEAALGRLLACLPCLENVTCDAEVLHALVPLRKLRWIRVRDWKDPMAADAATAQLEGYAQRRGALLTSDMRACPVRVSFYVRMADGTTGVMRASVLHDGAVQSVEWPNP